MIGFIMNLINTSLIIRASRVQWGFFFLNFILVVLFNIL